MGEEALVNRVEEVIAVVSRKTGIPVSRLSLNNRLLHDLGVDGDDAAELFLELERVFGLDLGSFRGERYFRSEPHLFNIFRRPSAQRMDIEGKVPVTISDLVDAVEHGRWRE